MLLRPTKLAVGTFILILLVYIWRHYLNIPSPREEILSDYSTILDGALKVNQSTAENPSQEEPYSSEKLVSNSTLGFQKVIAIGLPERTDRRDTLRLMSASQDVDLMWINAVRGEQISRKAWPPNWEHGSNEGKNLTLAELGCWRSHSDALLQIMEEGYASALIIEDDVDWDVRLKTQLNQFAEQSRSLDNDLRTESEQIGPDTPTTSPYGDRWDILWLGTCSTPSVEGNKREKSFLWGEGDKYYVFPIGSGAACTFAYAVTQTSAKMLYEFLQDSDKPVDFMIGDYCAGGKECRIVWPQLISSWAIGRDSDIRHIEVKAKAKDDSEEATWKIKNSAVLEMLRKNRQGKSKEVESSDE